MVPSNLASFGAFSPVSPVPLSSSACFSTPSGQLKGASSRASWGARVDTYLAHTWHRGHPRAGAKYVPSMRLDGGITGPTQGRFNFSILRSWQEQGGWGRAGDSQRAPSVEASDLGTTPFGRRPWPTLRCYLLLNHVDFSPSRSPRIGLSSRLGASHNRPRCPTFQRRRLAALQRRVFWRPAIAKALSAERAVDRADIAARVE